MAQFDVEVICTVPGGEVSALHHEVLDDPVEGAALVGPRLVLGRAGTERTEVLAGDRDKVVEELKDDPALRLATDLDVEEDLETKNGSKNVKSARCRPILSANSRRPRPAHVYARADPGQTGQRGGN